ncbi:MAG TPA: hypothetical protein PKA64_09040, partial [Myxococcota bacterium]|nr:hypothetical protein [Myxococcota bacterium]
GGVGWYDWWTLAPAASGPRDVALDEIPVFARSGTTTPLFDHVPTTLTDATDDGFDAADASRRVILWGGGGPFVEADGTRYAPRGAPTGPAEVTVTLDGDGVIDAGGVTLDIQAPRARAYTIVVVP